MCIVLLDNAIFEVIPAHKPWSILHKYTRSKKLIIHVIYVICRNTVQHCNKIKRTYWAYIHKTRIFLHVQLELCSGHRPTTHFSQSLRWWWRTEIPLSPRSSALAGQELREQVQQGRETGVSGERASSLASGP